MNNIIVKHTDKAYLGIRVSPLTPFIHFQDWDYSKGDISFVNLEGVFYWVVGDKAGNEIIKSAFYFHKLGNCISDMIDTGLKEYESRK